MCKPDKKPSLRDRYLIRNNKKIKKKRMNLRLHMCVCLLLTIYFQLINIDDPHTACCLSLYTHFSLLTELHWFEQLQKMYKKKKTNCMQDDSNQFSFYISISMNSPCNIKIHTFFFFLFAFILKFFFHLISRISVLPYFFLNAPRLLTRNQPTPQQMKINKNIKRIFSRWICHCCCLLLLLSILLPLVVVITTLELKSLSCRNWGRNESYV